MKKKAQSVKKPSQNQDKKTDAPRKKKPAAPRINLLQVLPSLESGGVERGTIEIVREVMHEKGLAIVCSAGGQMVQHITNSGGVHITLPVDSKNPFVIIKNIFRINNIIAENNINIVHARSRAPAWSAYFACIIAKCKFVTTFHGTYSTSGKLKRFYNSIMLKGDAVIAISRFIAKHIETQYRYKSSKLHVVHRGVDLEHFNSKNVSKARVSAMQEIIASPDKKISSGAVILLPARFVRWKGHLLLLKALQYLKNQNYTCIMVGKSTPEHFEYMQEIKDQIFKYKLEDRVLIRESVSDMPALYMMSDIVVCTSSEKPEAFGRTIVEAQAMGKIIIATAHGGPAEIIEDNKTGFLFSHTDPSALADAIFSTIKMSKKDKEQMITQAQKTITKNFSMDAMCKKVISIYKIILAPAK